MIWLFRWGPLHRWSLSFGDKSLSIVLEIFPNDQYLCQMIYQSLPLLVIEPSSSPLLLSVPSSLHADVIVISSLLLLYWGIHLMTRIFLLLLYWGINFMTRRFWVLRQSALPSWTLLTTACVTRCLWGSRGSSRSVVEVELVVVVVVA